jgi:hypothetical protein
MRRSTLTTSDLARAVRCIREGQSMEDEFGRAMGAPSECFTDIRNGYARDLRRLFTGVRGGVVGYNDALARLTTPKWAYYSGLTVMPDELEHEPHEWMRPRRY